MGFVADPATAATRPPAPAGPISRQLILANGGPGVGVGEGVGVGVAGFGGIGEAGIGEAVGSAACAAVDANKEKTPQNDSASSVRRINSKLSLSKTSA